MKNNTFSMNMLKIASAAAFACALTFAVSIFAVSSAHASVQPTLTLTNDGNGSVQVTVAGDSDASIQLFYYTSANGSGNGAAGSVASAGIIGNTAANGYFSTTLSGYVNGVSGGYTGTYSAFFNSIPYGAPVYVVVDGLQSASVAWPYNGNIIGNPGTVGVGSLYFNASSINLTVGQSQSVQIYQNSVYNSGYTNGSNYGTGSYYISSNSDSSVVNASISGSSVYISALAPGNATVTVCQSGTVYAYPYAYTSGTANGQCASLYVTVNYANNYSSYPGYPSYPTTYPTPYVAPIVSVPQVQVQVPLYIPATVYSAPSYSTYPYGYGAYPVTYPTYTTSAYYSTPSYYPYY